MTWTDQPDEVICRAAAERVIGWTLVPGLNGYCLWCEDRPGHRIMEIHDFSPHSDLNQLAQVFRAALNQHGQVEGAADLWLLAIEHPRRVLCALLDALEIPEPEPEPEQ